MTQGNNADTRQPIESPLTERSAGLLLHLTSLPGKYGVGDMGEEARQFISFLKAAGQKYWQLLPINPTESGNGHSPYSSFSSIAGNPLLISPQWLADHKWVTPGMLAGYEVPSLKAADYQHAESFKVQLFKEAYKGFSRSRSSRFRKQYSSFREKQKSWLDDFAMYTLLKSHHHGAPWYEWPAEYRRREKKALQKLKKENSEKLDLIRWIQFVFFTQWEELRKDCRDAGIRLIGDLPIYVSYDSADVWSYPEIFSVSKKGSIEFIAGVPPDYFNEDGQLWGMPVFRWKELKKDGYKWWIHRVRKNIELYDLIRLDHFRAFADYWAVPSGESTAKNGKWAPGPDKDFFNALRNKMGSLPFIAEDLGDINEKVYRLRDAFKLPGMKVLHFAFSDNMPSSDYIPHNYKENFVVYTGTHDNNTTRGWYEKDATEIEKENIEKYFGFKVKSRDIHQWLIRLAYQTVAATAIIPVQDVLGLGAAARMNSPASVENNWQWRMKGNELTDQHSAWLKEQTVLFNR